MKTTEIIIEFTQYALGINMRSYFSMNLYSEKLMDIDYSIWWQEVEWKNSQR